MSVLGADASVPEQDVALHDWQYTRRVTDDAMQVLEAALGLPDDERARLVAVLRDSITHDASQEEIDAAILAEVMRRREDLRSGRTKAVPYDEVRRKLDAMIELSCCCASFPRRD